MLHHQQRLQKMLTRTLSTHQNLILIWTIFRILLSLVEEVMVRAEIVAIMLMLWKLSRQTSVAEVVRTMLTLSIQCSGNNVEIMYGIGTIRRSENNVDTMSNIETGKFADVAPGFVSRREMRD